MSCGQRLHELCKNPVEPLWAEGFNHQVGSGARGGHRFGEFGLAILLFIPSSAHLPPTSPPHLPPTPPPHLSPTFLQNLEMCPEYLPVLESFVAAATSALDAAPPREEEAEDGAAPTAHIGCLGVGCLGASASASPLPPRLPPR